MINAAGTGDWGATVLPVMRSESDLLLVKRRLRWSSFEVVLRKLNHDCVENITSTYPLAEAVFFLASLQRGPVFGQAWWNPASSAPEYVTEASVAKFYAKAAARVHQHMRPDAVLEPRPAKYGYFWCIS